MPPAILILTDEVARSLRLLRDLADPGPFIVRDIFEAACASGDPLPSVVLSDVDLTRSDALQSLRRHLADACRGGAPLLCLLRRDTARANIQALALGASQVLPLGASVAPLAAALNLLLKGSAPVPVAVRVSQIGASIAQMLADTEPPAPDAAESTAGLVLQIISEVGVREWLDLVWRFDNMTHQHCMLVAGLAGGFGDILGFGRSDRYRLMKSALLHDVGKARIPKEILNKPGPLDDAEIRIMRRHPEFGQEMLIGKGYSDDLLAVVRSHHEMLDGSGYPDGLGSRHIPDLVRLVTICDIYAALIERRPYRAPMSGERAYQILLGMSGKLDAAMLGAFRPLVTECVKVP